MFLYLVQHADAKKEEIDPKRPLSEKGINDITKTSLYLTYLNISLHKIFHSQKLRAKQTAEILFQHLKPIRGITEIDGLSPLDDPEIWYKRLQSIPEDIMLVGHLPHLSRLASLLLCGDKEKDIVEFKMAGIVCLRKEANSWLLQWMLTPEITITQGESKPFCDSI
jgi:phosphohistidine phosphatase